MSITYLVYDYQHHQLAVLKEIDAQLAQKLKAREMFQREAHTLKSLHHGGIPKFYDFFWTRERYSLILEMIQGQNLLAGLKQILNSK